MESQSSLQMGPIVLQWSCAFQSSKEQSLQSGLLVVVFRTISQLNNCSLLPVDGLICFLLPLEVKFETCQSLIVAQQHLVSI